MAKAQVDSGSPTFCWHCGRQLQRVKLRSERLFYFELVKDQIGHVHRVHLACKVEAIADGARNV